MIRVILFLLFSLNIFADWVVDKRDDPFNGKSTNVLGMDMDKKGAMVFTDKNSIIILNGDNYICTNPNYSSYQFIDVQFRVDGKNFSQEFAISDKRNSLEFREKYIGNGLTISKSDFTKSFSKKVYSNRGIDVKKFANMLKSKRLVLIRTVDGCGEQVDLRFDMEGFAEAISQLGLGYN